MQDDESISVESPAENDVVEISNLYLASRADALPYLRQLHSDSEVLDWIRYVLFRSNRIKDLSPHIGYSSCSDRGPSGPSDDCRHLSVRQFTAMTGHQANKSHCLEAAARALRYRGHHGSD